MLLLASSHKSPVAGPIMFSSAPSPLVTLARKAAASQSLDPALVCAVVEQESNWNPWAMRYEPAFFSKYVARYTPITRFLPPKPTRAVFPGA